MFKTGAGGVEASLADLHKIKLEKPAKAGQHWQGVPHFTFVGEVRAALDRAGFTTHGQTFHTSPNKRVLVAAWHVHIPGLRTPDGWRCGIAAITGNDRHHGIRMASGMSREDGEGSFVFAQVAAPENRNHTSGRSLPDTLDKFISAYHLDAKAMLLAVQNMKQTRITDTEADMIFMECGRQAYLPWSMMGVAWTAWKNAKQAAGCAWTAWHICLAINRALGDTSVLKQLQRMACVYQITRQIGGTNK